MACRAVWNGFDQQCVIIAIGKHLFDIQEVAACFTFGPQGGACPAEEGHAVCGDGRIECFTVHIPEHEHFKRDGVLDDDRQEAVGTFIKFEIVEGHNFEDKL